MILVQNIFKFFHNQKLIAIVMLLLIVSITIGSAQEIDADLKKVGEKYQNGHYKLEVVYSFYGGHDGRVVLDQQNTSIIKKGDYFHTNQFGTEIITNNKYVLIIDHSNEVVAIDKKREPLSKEERINREKESKKLYDELYAALGIDPSKIEGSEKDIKTTYLGRIKGKVGYRFSYPSGEYEHLELYIDPKSYLLKEVWMYFRKPMEVEEGVYKKPKVKLAYGKQIINPALDKNTFSIDKYVDISTNGEVAIVHKAYKNFELINHLKQ